MSRWSCPGLPPVVSRRCQGTSEYLERRARKRDQLRRRLVHPFEHFLPCLCPRGGKHDKLHTPVSGNRPPLGESPLFQPINDPRRVRRIASPFVGKGSHGSPSGDVEGTERASIVGGQTHPGEHATPLHPCPHEEVEHAFPRFSREGGFVPGHGIEATSRPRLRSTINTVLSIK